MLQIFPGSSQTQTGCGKFFLATVLKSVAQDVSFELSKWPLAHAPDMRDSVPDKSYNFKFYGTSL